MDFFSVINVGETDEALDRKIGATYKNSHLRISPTVWLVADKGVTTSEVCTKLNIKPDGFRSAVVLKFDSYFGVAPRNIWEWLSVKGGE